MHPARFPADLPGCFVRMLTDPGDIVVDPFGGSCVTGEVCQRLGRSWQCIDLSREYLEGAVSRFHREAPEKAVADLGVESNYYRVPRPGLFWSDAAEDRLPEDGGKKRLVTQKTDPKKVKKSEDKTEDRENCVPNDPVHA